MQPSDKSNREFRLLRKEAKRLLKQVQSGVDTACERFLVYWPASPRGNGSDFMLTQAQLVIAREHGYTSWTHLKTSLLHEKDKTMTATKSNDKVKRLGVYTYEETESLLEIPQAEIKRMMSVDGKPPPRYLTAVDIEKVWVQAKPFIVTLKCEGDSRKVGAEDILVIEEAVLQAGGILAVDMLQLRFSTLEEAQQVAQSQPIVPGYTWVAFELGFATRTKVDGEKKNYRIEGPDPGDKLLKCWLGFPVQNRLIAG